MSLSQYHDKFAFVRREDCHAARQASSSEITGIRKTRHFNRVFNPDRATALGLLVLCGRRSQNNCRSKTARQDRPKSTAQHKPPHLWLLRLFVSVLVLAHV